MGGHGLYCGDGCKANFTCINMNFTECGGCGVVAHDTNGKLVDCLVTRCGSSGVYCWNGLIEVFGERTTVNGNCTKGTKRDSRFYGLMASSPSSKIVLHSPLTKELVSTNNSSGGNWGGDGKIENIFSLEEMMSKVDEDGRLHVRPGLNSVAKMFASIKHHNVRVSELYLESGVHKVQVKKNKDGNDRNYIEIDSPITIGGAGTDKTFVEGGLLIQGKKWNGEVVVKQMTVQKSKGCGLYCGDGCKANFTCINMNFTECGICGVVANDTNGKLVDCLVTRCGSSGVYCWNGLIEFFGERTTVNGNCTKRETRD